MKRKIIFLGLLLLFFSLFSFTYTPLYAMNEDNLLLVNKHHSLDPNYVPSDLTLVRVPFATDEDVPRKYMRKEAAYYLEQLFSTAQQQHIELIGVSGYRSYETQKGLYEGFIQTLGEYEAKRISAYPGQSEHQTGLAMDVSSYNMNFQLQEVFGETKEGQWIANHAHEFGFIIRYLKEKENVTGYRFEPWHIRYVGIKPATYMVKHHLTLEEYLNQPHHLTCSYSFLAFLTQESSYSSLTNDTPMCLSSTYSQTFTSFLTLIKR